MPRADGLRPAAARARRVAPPAHVEARQTLPSHDYGDAFEIPLPLATEREAEQWARAIFESSAMIADALYAIWSLVCRLRLGARGSERHVLGWEIVASSPRTIVLDADSHGVHAQLVIWAGSSALGLATFARYRTFGGRLLFSSIAPIHRQIAPFLLLRTARGASPSR